MNPFLPLSPTRRLVVSVALSCACVSLSCTASEYLTDIQRNIALGRAFNPTTGEVLDLQACLGPIDSPQQAPTYHQYATASTDFRQFVFSAGLDLQTRARFSAFGISAVAISEAQFRFRQVDTANSVSWTIRAERDGYDTLSNPVLTTNTSALLSRDPQQFEVVYGREYVSSVLRGSSNWQASFST